MSKNNRVINIEVPLFKQRLLECLREEEKIIYRKRRRTRANRWTAAAAMLLLVLGWGYIRSTIDTPATDLISVKIQKTYGFTSMDNIGATVSSVPDVNDVDQSPLDVKKAINKKAILKMVNLIDVEKEQIIEENAYAVAY